ncbi:MAG TPA: hypothetical protein VLX92_11750 [Kofleriaceae bacterium]|nr:hypothetical protein [Kofleriaceae bacterium]
MYRDDGEALLRKAESAAAEAERLERENVAMRAEVARIQAGRVPTTFGMAFPVYQLRDVAMLPLGERARLAQHAVRPFPVWLVGILNVLTLGLFPLIHFGMLHDRLPRAAHNDPSAGKAIGFQFIPYFNLYWIFFSALRLCDRLTLQAKLRRQPFGAPRGLVVAACVLTVIPYINFFIGIPIVWTIAVCLLQSTVNKVAALDPAVWDAGELPGRPAYAPPLPQVAMPPPSPAQLAHAARARTLVNWSHVLGWGGLGLLVVGSPVMLAAAGGIAAGTLAGLAAIAVVVGAVLGQIGRGMQGRAI